MKTTNKKPNKGYGLVQTDVMVNSTISYGAKALYCYYCTVQGKNDSSWKSNDTIIKEMNISKNFFYKIKKELLDLGLITSIKRSDTSSLVSVNYIEKTKLVSTLKRDYQSTLKRDLVSTTRSDYNINNLIIGDGNINNTITSKSSLQPVEIQSIIDTINTINANLKYNKPITHLNSKDTQKLMRMLKTKDLEELIDLLNSYESRSNIKYVSVSYLYKQVFGKI